MRKIKVLIIDDKESFIKAVKTQLDLSGFFEVHYGLYGANAEQLINEEDPDLLIIDWNLSNDAGAGDWQNADGIVVANKIRNNPKYNNVAILVVTATYTEADLIKYNEEHKVKRILYTTKKPTLLMHNIAACFFLTWNSERL